MSIASIEAVCFEHRPTIQRRAFVYFLVVDQRIVYVGQTNNLEIRVQQHWTLGNTFDRVLAREVPVDQIDMYEGALVRALLPVLNRRCPVYRGGDNAVRAEFGLPLLEDEAVGARAAMTVVRGRQGPRGTPDLLGRRTTASQHRRNSKLTGRRFLFQAVIASAAAARRASS